MVCQLLPKNEWTNLFCLLSYSSQQTNQIRPFVFWENLRLGKLFFDFTWPLVQHDIHILIPDTKLDTLRIMVGMVKIKVILIFTVFSLNIILKKRVWFILGAHRRYPRTMLKKWALSTNFWKQIVCWHHPAMFCLITSSKLSLPWFEF